jgi:hypothetical protein
MTNSTTKRGRCFQSGVGVGDDGVGVAPGVFVLMAELSGVPELGHPWHAVNTTLAASAATPKRITRPDQPTEPL